MAVSQQIGRTGNVSDAGDFISTGEKLIFTGGRTHDGQVIKRGIELLKSVDYPFYFIIAIARYLIQESKKP
ncbi:MAG: hypothetical protein AAB876_00055 [Patescibacteria group bacterium]